MKKQTLVLVIVFFAVLILFDCAAVYQGEPKWEFPNKLENTFLIPVGRRTNPDNGLEVMINNTKSTFLVYTDFALGNWIVVPESNSPACIKVIIKNSNQYHIIQPIDTKNDHIWTQPSILIDSDSSNIKKVAMELKQQLNSRDLIVSTIQEYVRENIKHKDYYGHFSKKASETLTIKYGTCVNRARLFVALCRACGIPARTVWGYFYILPEANMEGHHEWAEYLNDENQWVPLEFDPRLYTFKNITRPYIGHIDLVYSAEENPIFLLANDFGSTLLYKSEESNWINGKFGFKITENNYPVSLIVENNFKIE